MQRLSFSRLPLVLAAGALVAGSWAVLAPVTPAAAGAEAMLCTRVVENGTCVVRYGPITYCHTVGGTGCPTGTHFVSASDSPRPCMPVGGPCTRTFNCCLDEN